MPDNDKGITLLEALFAVIIASAGITAALEVHSIALKNRLWNEQSLRAQTKIESRMERDRGRLKTLTISGHENPVESMFGHIQTSPLSCGDLSKVECLEIGENSGKICRAPESNNGVVKIKYIACIGENSFKGEQFIYVPEK